MGIDYVVYIIYDMGGYTTGAGGHFVVCHNDPASYHRVQEHIRTRGG